MPNKVSNPKIFFIYNLYSYISPLEGFQANNIPNILPKPIKYKGYKPKPYTQEDYKTINL